MNSTASKSVRKARLLIVDDHPLFREGLGQLIDRQKDLLCCGQADSRSTTLEAVKSQQPDLVVLDLRLRHEDGLELIKSLKTQFAGVRMLTISQHDEALYAERALRAGASGYVMKEEATEEVLTAIRTVLGGQLYVSRKIAMLLLHKMLESPPQFGQPGLECLSDRELQVFQMLGAGLSTRQIAGQWQLSFKTVETHRENIKHKLGLHTASELIHAATTWVQAGQIPGGRSTGPPESKSIANPSPASQDG